MGLFEKIFGGGRVTSGFEVQERPGVFGTPDSRRLAERAEAGLGGIVDPELLGGLKSALGIEGARPFETSTAQTNILNQIMDLAGGRSATRGLGPGTASGLAKSIAPTLAGFQTSTAANISNALQGLGELSLGGVQGATNLAQLAGPQFFSGGVSQSTETPGILGTLSKFR